MSKIMLVDGNSIANRAYYALPPMSNKKGIYTNAIVGFMNMLFRFYDLEKPDLIRVSFDLKAPTFRHIAYKDYKGQRKAMPDELKMQMPILKELLGLMNIPIMQMEGFEADDLIGTMAKTYEKKGYDVAIVSGDRDLLQVATDKICVTMPRTKGGKTEIEKFYAKDVEEKMGVTPLEYIDVKALMGDTSDNVPGVPGIGEKTAFKLIGDYKSLDNLYEHIDEVSGAKAKQNLIDYKDKAYESQYLVTIKLDVPMDTETKPFGPINNNALQEKLEYLETRALLERINKSFEYQEVDIDEFKNNAKNNLAFEKNIDEEETQEEKVEVGEIETENKIEESKTEKTNDTIIEVKTSSFKKEYKKYFEEINFVKTKNDLDVLIKSLDKEVCIDIYTRDNELLAYALAFDKKVCYIEKTSLLNDVEDIFEDTLFNTLDDIFKNENIIKICYDIKKDFKFLLLNKDNIKFNNYHDVMIAYYVSTIYNGPYKIEDFARDYLEVRFDGEDLFKVIDQKGKVKSKERLYINDLEDANKTSYLLDKMNIIYNGYINLNNELKENEKKLSLFNDVENPLVYVLSKMEAAGVKININELKKYSEDIKDKLNEVTKNIYSYAGCEFNISSPKQLADVLFNKMGIESKKKTKSKTGMSTSADTLEKLVDVHPIISEVLLYRQLEKIRSTYADGLFDYIDSDEKIHTTFTQVVTQTGRLSSVDPNLQNIPIKVEIGRKIRKAFVPKSEDYIFIDADYSQVELRVMTHMSGDQKLIDGYNSGEDIHKITASQVFEVPLEEVTSEMRSNAKAVNFGIIYGISAFGLSEDIHISRKEADKYIENYFAKYSRVKEYLDELVENAKTKGYSETLYGRQRKIDEINSSNHMQREFGKRVAMNSPVQGTAADIMKIAMVNFNNRIEKEKIDARIIIQVHDELVVEARRDEREKVANMLKEEMEHAANLLVPLIAEVKSGDTWYETK